MPVARRADFRWFSEDDYLQLFRLQQLISEYLLYVQETLHRRNVTLESGVGAAQAQLQDQAEYIGVLEAQLRDRGGGAHVGLQAVARCGLCNKAFATNAFLQAHIKRRHPGYSQPCAVSCSAQRQRPFRHHSPCRHRAAPQPQPMPPPSRPPVGAAVQPRHRKRPIACGRREDDSLCHGGGAPVRSETKSSRSCRNSVSPWRRSSLRDCATHLHLASRSRSSLCLQGMASGQPTTVRQVASCRSSSNSHCSNKLERCERKWTAYRRS